MKKKFNRKAVFDSVDKSNLRFNKYTEQDRKDFQKEVEFIKSYPLIYSLGLSIVSDPYPHIPGKVLRKALEKHKITSKFNKAFGVNTMMLLDNGDSGVYPVDIERTLRQILRGIEPTIEEWD